jgi:nucleoside-diphosphate-sugar epimerase
MRIFVSGGAGFIGCKLIPLLLENGHEVFVYDNFMFNNGDKLLPFITNPNFSFVKGDVRDRDTLKKHIKGHDVIIHLAALVGYNICRNYGLSESTSINVDGTKSVLECIDDNQFLIFASTGSNYGEVKGICTEETPLNPLSIYGQTKTLAEQLIVKENKNFTAFRFATAFGVSNKLRLDLLINDLAYKAWSEKYVVVYEPHFLRTFIHIQDMARAFLFAINNQNKMRGQIYNIGSNKMNFSKREVCELIKSKIKAEFNYSGTLEDADKRNYVVSYDKVNTLGYDTTITIEQGIDELLKTFPLIKIINPYYNI